MFVIGIDAGGTKTVCQLATDGGVVVGEARSSGANLQADGELAVEKVLHTVMDEVLGRAGVRPDAICLGMAGVDRPDDTRVVRAMLTRIGHAARLLVVNDALIALETGAPGRAGLVIIAGTGSIAYGRDGHGRAARAGGWGYVLGDEGSGYWIGRHALRAVVRAADRRGPATQLSDSVLAHFGVRRAPELVHVIYDGAIRPAEVAALAGLVQDAAAAGDRVATHILEAGARELASAAQSVAVRLGLHQTPAPVVLAGGVFRAAPTLAENVVVNLHATWPAAKISLLDVGPVSGAVRLAIALLAGQDAVPVYVTD